MQSNQNNHNNLNRLKYARCANWQFLTEIKAYFESLEFRLPSNKKMYEKALTEYFSDGEISTKNMEKIADSVELGNTYYAIKNAMQKPCLANITENNGKMELGFAGAFYSKNRMDNVWLAKKPKIIRAVWHQAVKEAQLMENYEALHLTLTVPHADGEWRGKKFYARELLQCFTKMRRQRWWKRSFFGGEYNMEISQQEYSKNGLHIHLHALVFVYKDVQIDMLRARLQKEWHSLTGASQIRLEDLYIYKRKNNGQILKKDIPYAIIPLEKGKTTRLKCDYFGTMWESHHGKSYINVNGELCDFEEVKVREKFYLKDSWNRSLSKEEQEANYQSAIMEAIKYNFEMDSLKYETSQEGKTFKIELIAEILKYSKYFRFHGKFGEFYGKGCVAKYFKYVDNENSSVEMLFNGEDLSEEYDSQYCEEERIQRQASRDFIRLREKEKIEIEFDSELAEINYQFEEFFEQQRELENSSPPDYNIHLFYPEMQRFSFKKKENNKADYFLIFGKQIYQENFVKVRRLYQDEITKRFIIQLMATNQIDDLIDPEDRKKYGKMRERFFVEINK